MATPATSGTRATTPRRFPSKSPSSNRNDPNCRRKSRQSTTKPEKRASSRASFVNLKLSGSSVFRINLGSPLRHREYRKFVASGPSREMVPPDDDSICVMRILLLNLGTNSAVEVSTALAGQGYDIANESALGVEQIESFAPALLITEATPSDLSCCGIITQIKSRERTKSIRVLMVVQGGALERARALDLGADDVISSPFDPTEFAARVRTQFREREPEEMLRGKLRQAEAKEHLAELAVETLSGGAVTRKRMWVLPALLVLCVVAVIAALVTSLTYRRSRSDALQLKAEVARLSRGVV